MSDSLRPRESQHARPPCPSPTPGVHWDSRPSGHQKCFEQWHPLLDKVWITSKGQMLIRRPEELPQLLGSRLLVWIKQLLKQSSLFSQHWNMYIIIYETDCQFRFDAWDRVLRAGALGWPRGMGWGGRWEWGSGWGTHVNPWLIHINVWQNPLQYCKVISLQLK